MAIGWLSVLKAVPWGEVISNAPKVADGAKKLWKTVARKPPAPVADAEQPTLAPEALSPAALQAQLAAAEASLAELHDQMLSSSELIQALAEQNAQLIGRVEALRVRLLWLSGATLLLVISGIVALTKVLMN